MASTHMILADTNLEPKQARQMLQEVGNLDGVEQALGLDSLVGSAIPQELLPSGGGGNFKGRPVSADAGELLLPSLHRVNATGRLMQSMPF